MDKDMFFFSHTAHESADDSGRNCDLARRDGGGKLVAGDKSKKNEAEAAMVAALAVYLRQQDYKPPQITVLACYVGQAFELKFNAPFCSHRDL